jgi:hypothetical protein
MGKQLECVKIIFSSIILDCFGRQCIFCVDSLSSLFSGRHRIGDHCNEDLEYMFTIRSALSALWQINIGELNITAGPFSLHQ